MRMLLRLVLLLTLAGPTLASDGVSEINQTCAVQTGCFSGDTAGFPVTITAGGSYRLTSNLRQSRPVGEPQSATFIEISGDGVTLDLAGFRISCSTFLGGCSGFEDGVSASVASGTTIKNGSLQGIGGDGVSAGQESLVSGLRVSGSGQVGIKAGPGSVVWRNTVTENQSAGIVAGSGSTISGNTVISNESTGISALNGCLVESNVSAFNGNIGMSLDDAAAYRGNVVTSNTSGAITGGVNLGENFCAGTGVTLPSCP